MNETALYKAELETKVDQIRKIAGMDGDTTFEEVINKLRAKDEDSDIEDTREGGTTKYKTKQNGAEECCTKDEDVKTQDAEDEDGQAKRVKVTTLEEKPDRRKATRKTLERRLFRGSYPERNISTNGLPRELQTRSFNHVRGETLSTSNLRCLLEEMKSSSRDP